MQRSIFFDRAKLPNSKGKELKGRMSRDDQPWKLQAVQLLNKLIQDIQHFQKQSKEIVNYHRTLNHHDNQQLSKLFRELFPQLLHTLRTSAPSNYYTTDKVYRKLQHYIVGSKRNPAGVITELRELEGLIGREMMKNFRKRVDQSCEYICQKRQNLEKNRELVKLHYEDSLQYLEVRRNAKSFGKMLNERIKSMNKSNFQPSKVDESCIERYHILDKAVNSSFLPQLNTSDYF